MRFPDNGFLWVTNQGGSTVCVIDPATNTVVDTIAVGNSPTDIDFNPCNGLIYVANFDIKDISVIAHLTTTFSEGCNGPIGNAGQATICTITKVYGR
jgi:YVTN family beta-propeller protein